MPLFDSPTRKCFKSPDYNFDFDKITGTFKRWGVTLEDDPNCAPSPEIIDVELSSTVQEEEETPFGTIITPGGCSGRGCGGNWCYKGNKKSGNTCHMTLERFKQVFTILPKTITQIAFGICSSDSHPQLFDIAKHTRDNGVAANITVNGIGFYMDLAKKYAENFNAIAISINKLNIEDAIGTFFLIRQWSDMQLTFHFMLANETLEDAYLIIDKLATSNLKNIGALLFLGYKPKNPNCNFTSVRDSSVYKKLTEYANSKGLNVGFDSCSAHMYDSTIQDHPNREKITQMIEPCESGLFSLYMSNKGIFYPCSFMEGVGDWVEGISVGDVDNFSKDVWFSLKLTEWRNKLLDCKRNCPQYQMAPYFEKVPN
jgi:hypothetical protein